MTKIFSIQELEQFKAKLLTAKEDLLNQVKSARKEFQSIENRASGDEVDQSQSLLTEHSFLVNQERMRSQLFEIEMALARIEAGTFGLCEETEEPIESDRLHAIPWTRLSIEGAELREEVSKRFAR